MRLIRPQPLMRSEPVIALVDVVFFLLVFFMLVARLDASAPFQVLPPVAVSGSDMPGGGITVSVSADGAVAVDGRPPSEGDWLAAVVRAAKDGRGDLIRINAHRAAEMRHILTVLSQLDRASIGKVVIVVTPSEP